MSKIKSHYDDFIFGGKLGRKQITFSAKTVKRSMGQSALSKAAYRSGEKLFDARIGRTFDYTHKDDILHSEIIAPDNAPDFVYDREKLWNAVEAVEKRKDAQLARDIIAALPRELSFEQNLELTRKFVQENFVRHGMIVDFSIHESEASDGGKNPHVHIMLTMRDLTSDSSPSSGFGKKNRDWNKKAMLQAWREQWTQILNDALEDADAPVRFDHRTLEAQGIDRMPTFHLGAAASSMEEKGIHTDKGQRLLLIQGKNSAMIAARDNTPEQSSNARLERFMRWKEFSHHEDVIPRITRVIEKNEEERER